MNPRRLFALLSCLVATASAEAALGERSSVTFEALAGGFTLADNGHCAPILVDANDWPGVVRVAHDLQADVERVSGQRPALQESVALAPALVIVGTLGKSSFIDKLVSDGRIDTSGIRGKWESWVSQVVDHPFPGVERALVIAGGDKRGTIYGAYNLSEEMGVSPWYWWADVPAARHPSIFVHPEAELHGPPGVKYRGIFLNDEAPDLSNWVKEKFGTAPVGTNPPVPEGIANYGHEFYSRIFEVILRLRGNYLWPAMWNNAFNEDDPANAAMADEFGVVMGTSHQEPMLRAQKEWDRRYGATLGHWNYSRDAGLLKSFWTDGVRRNRGFESIYTLGLRGANDTEMAPGGPAANRAMLEGIVGTQRDILRAEVNPDLTKIPQMWCLYKEVQEYYESGMRTPDDVTLLWADDNWGDLRRVPTTEERTRAGGAGIYYHFDYVGDPRNYKWIDTNSLAKTWDQLSMAASYGADRLWIVNVGHFKGYERPTEFFMRLAWAPSQWGPDSAEKFTQLWAAREFGTEHAAEIASLVDRLTMMNNRRKPELLSPQTYSLVNYSEANTVVSQFAILAGEARRLQMHLPEAQRDAFYELVAFPAKAASIVNALYVSAATNDLYARQGRAHTAYQASEVRMLFKQDQELMDFYNKKLGGGRWDHFMDQSHIGYSSWRDPPANTLDPIELKEPMVAHAARLGIAVEGCEDAWPGTTAVAPLPQFDSINSQTHYVEVFDRGDIPFGYTVTPSAPWIVVDKTQGTANPSNQLVFVSINWIAVPAGLTKGSIRISGADESVDVPVEVFRDALVTRATVRGFVENGGVVSIEPEHFTGYAGQPASGWTRISNYGRTLSGMRAEAPVNAAPKTPGTDAACLEYRFYLLQDASVAIDSILSPTLNFLPGKPLRYAVGIDDQAPQAATAVPGDFSLKSGREDWQKTVEDNARTVRSPLGTLGAGYHTLKIWAVDPGVVLQKLIIDAGGLRPSYLGPPESLLVKDRRRSS